MLRDAVENFIGIAVRVDAFGEVLHIGRPAVGDPPFESGHVAGDASAGVAPAKSNRFVSPLPSGVAVSDADIVMILEDRKTGLFQPSFIDSASAERFIGHVGLNNTAQNFIATGTI